MDLALDREKAKQLDCTSCNAQMQHLRNCSGLGAPAKVYVNGTVYARCTRATMLESTPERYLVKAFFSFRDSSQYPAGGSYSDQTAYAVELFEYLESIVTEYQIKQAEKHKAASQSR